MRILLAHNSTYYPALGGGDKSNRLLMEALAARGHSVLVVARMEEVSENAHERLLSDLAERSVPVQDSSGGVVRFERNGVAVRTLTSNPQLREYFRSQIEEHKPDVIISSTDDQAQILLEVALQAPDVRVVYLARATIALPFGPDAAFRSPAKTAILRTVDGIVGVSHYVAGYIREHGGIPAIHVPISLVDSGPAPNLGRFENPYITMVNPCAVKGISIFLGLARTMPELEFAAVPSWGTNHDDMEALQAEPNITVLEPRDQIDDILRLTRVMLIPSVWAEARSRMVVEAMSRGIPVLASDVGGLTEAKLGVPYLIPVNPVTRYVGRFDDRMVPVADVPPQDLRPWQEVLRRLVTDRAHYDELAAESRKVALAYIDSISAEPFEGFMRELIASPPRSREKLMPAALSEEKHQLLALRVRQRRKQAAGYVPSLATAPRDKDRLFCFPYAGGGSVYRGWARALSELVAVIPVLLPGREQRSGEAFATDLRALAREIAHDMNDDLPRIFYGHSMGAVMAFEVACELRNLGKPLPLALMVGAARAPIYRLNWQVPPDPTDEEFAEQVQKLEGAPAELWQDPEARAMLLPQLSADARMYRRYVYEPRDPLPIPIYVYGGVRDPNVQREHLEGWQQHTTLPLELRMFESGHFFLQEPEFLQSLEQDLRELRR